MGCDIHMAVEVRGDDGEWRWVKNATVCRWCDGSKTLGHDEHKRPCYCTSGGEYEPGRGHGYGRRNYDAFGALANVRNGTWGEPTPFVAEPRGIPEDLSPELKTADAGDGSEGGLMFGDHSQTWLLLSELLAFDWQQLIKRDAIIDWQTFVKWDRKTPPTAYCAGAGNVISQSSAEDMVRTEVTPAGYRNVRVTWTETIAEATGDFHSEFIPDLVDLARRENVTPDAVRIVFGFDS